MTEVSLLTLDVETTLNATQEIGKAHPMHSSNRIVLLGTICYPYPSGGRQIGVYDLLPISDLNRDIANSNPDFIVGCNLSFDLLYLLNAMQGDVGKEFNARLQKRRLWDIQLAEYLLTGQQSKYPSLDEMSLKYGFPVKDDAVTKYFHAGMGADHVPMELLKPYLVTDLENTESIAKIQMQQAYKEHMFPLIISQMEALWCITEMMFNGLAVDETYFKEYTVEVANKFAETDRRLNTSVLGYNAAFPELYPVKDVNSATQWGKFLFGGTLKTSVSEPVGVYKNGKTKFKKVEHKTTSLPACDVLALDEWISEKTGKVSVDEKVLSHLKDKTKLPVLKTLLETLLSYRDINKQITTYIQGLGKHLMHTPDCYIHGKLTQVNTATGRLSSSSPNLQNISNNPIKKIFRSRYGLAGELVEFDFSQLEVAVLAHITKDIQLIADIDGGKDIHTELYKDMNGVKPTDAERKWFKRLTFGLIYGAGPKTLAENAGCDISVATKFVTTFYERYPAVKGWNVAMRHRSNVEGKHKTNEETGMTDVPMTWEYRSETNRKYVFTEYKSTYSADKDYSFSPTELKNYPVQGLATGDIVPMMLGILFRKFANRPGIYLVNTVHDSILFDVHHTVVDSLIKEVKHILDNTHQYYQETFDIPLALKLTAGCSRGLNWFDMEKVEL